MKTTNPKSELEILLENYKVESNSNFKNYAELYLQKYYHKCNSCEKYFNLNKGCQCRADDLGLT